MPIKLNLIYAYFSVKLSVTHPEWSWYWSTSVGSQIAIPKEWKVQNIVKETLMNSSVSKQLTDEIDFSIANMTIMHAYNDSSVLTIR